MRKLAMTLFCFAVLSSTAFAQDDHNDSAPLVSGYAVVTTTAGAGQAGNAGGLVAFESLGWRINSPAIQASVLPATLTTRMVFFSTANARLSLNTGVGICNPGATDATVTMVLRNAAGAQTSTNTVTVPARQQAAKYVSELFAGVSALPPDFDGTLTVTSNLPVGVVAFRFTNSTFTTIPVASLSASVPLPLLTPSIGGSDGVLLPQFASNGFWATEIVVLNNGTQPITVRIDLFNHDGSPMVATLNHQAASSFANVVVAAGGTAILAPRNASGDSDF